MKCYFVYILWIMPFLIYETKHPNIANNKIELVNLIIWVWLIKNYHHLILSELQDREALVIILNNLGYVCEAYDHNRKQKVALKRIEKVGTLLSREYEILFEVKECEHIVKILVWFSFKRRIFSILEQKMGN